MGFNFTGECPFCKFIDESIDRLFKACALSKSISNNINLYFPSTIYADTSSLIEWSTCDRVKMV